MAEPRRVEMDDDDDYMTTTVVTDGVEDDEDEGQEAQEDVDDSEDSSSDDSDSEGEIGEEELASYRARVESNPQQYEAHVQLVAALRSMDGQEDALHQAREKMASIFPLPEDEWLEWLTDEERLARDDPIARMQVLSLYEQAVQDYRSVAVWERYLRFAGDFYRDDLTALRAVFEEALTAVGLHVAEGARVWEAYRQFELKHPAEVERIRKLFLRQLGVPLMGMDDTLQAYLAWESTHGGDPANGRRAYEAASARLQEYLPFEQEVAGPWSASNPDYTKLDAWKRYAQFEEQKNEPARVQMVYERAVQRYCLVPDLWISYLAYLERVLKGVHDVVLAVNRRAVRNYPWSSQLWADYIRALERASRTEQEATAVFEKSLQAGMSTADDFAHVFQTFADYQRRQLPPIGELKGNAELGVEKGASIRHTLQRAIDTLTTYFPESGWIAELRTYWGTLEARVFGDVEKAVVQWEEVLKTNGSDYDRWVQYAQCLWDALGAAGLDRVRAVYKRAANSLTHSSTATSLFSAWLTFERIYGDLGGFDEARRRQIAKLGQLMAREQQQYEQQQQTQEPAQHRAARQQRPAKGKGKGTKREAAFALPAPKPAKRRRGTEAESETGTAESAAGGSDGAAAGAPSQQASQPSETSVASKEAAVDATANAPASAVAPKESEKANEGQASMVVETDGASSDERTVRVNGLAFSMEEAEVRKAFETCGPVIDVRLVRGKENKSKGLAFVEFARVADAQAAVEREWKDDQRTWKVQRASAPRHTTPKPQVDKRSYDDSLTVFASNLSFDMGEDDIREVFGAMGSIKAVRLIRDHKQRSKGYAYIQYAAPESLLRALALNQTTVRGRIINVARSQPPAVKAKAAGGGNAAPSPSSAATPTSTKPATALMPRAVKKPGGGGLPGTAPSALPTAAGGAVHTSTTAASTGSTAKSNAHFRELIAKGKSRRG